MPVCAIMWCKKKSRVSNITSDGVTFHRFPRTPIRQEKWIASTGRPDTWCPTKNSAICSIHFEDSCFYHHGSTRRLYETSVPTLYLPALVSTIQHESIDIKSEVDNVTDDDYYEDPMSPEQEELVEKDELVETIESSSEIKTDVNDHDYEKPPSPKHVKLVRIVNLNQCNNFAKLQPLAPKLHSITSLKGLQPIAPKITSATVIGSLRPIAPKLGPGTLLPVNLRPLLNQPMPNNLNQSTTLVGIQPIKQNNFAIAPMPKPMAHKPVITALNESATASSPAKNNNSSIKIMASISSQESVQKNNNGIITENDLKIYGERALKRKIEHLKYTLDKKRQTIKCLQNQNRMWRNKVKSLKIMLQSLIKIKK